MTENKVEEATELFQRHREELGFVNRAQVREKSLYTVEKDGKVVGAALCNHCVRKPQTTLYDIVVDESYRRQGIASKLVRKISSDSPHDKIIAKCPVILDANAFYEKCGWEIEGVEGGKNHKLNIWKLEND